MSSVNHYENFPVASLLCPPALRPPIVAIYHFARTADDIADEGDATPSERLTALAQLRQDLQTVLESPDSLGLQSQDLLINLRQQILTFNLPVQLLFDLLDAFQQDVEYTRDARPYKSRAELLDYCRRSANPIGRLLLHLYGVNDPLSLAQSDAVCSALQLINFWQDLSVDQPRGRHYLPEGTDLAEEVVFARQLMMQGAPLVHTLPGRGGWELRMVVQGGLRILDKIEATNTRLERPRLHSHDYLRMLWRAARMTQSRP